jgi:hypothetical protein
MDEIISYKMCAVKVRNAKLRNYLKAHFSTQEKFPRTEHFPKISLLKDEKFQFVSANHISQNFLSAEIFFLST